MTDTKTMPETICISNLQERYFSDDVYACRHIIRDEPDRVYIQKSVHDEAVNELVDTLEFYVGICGNTCYEVPRETAREMYDTAKSVIAKYTVKDNS